MEPNSQHASTGTSKHRLDWEDVKGAPSEPGESAEQLHKLEEELVAELHGFDPWTHGKYPIAMETLADKLVEARVQLQEREEECKNMTELAQSYLHKIRALEADAKANTEWKRVAAERDTIIQRLQGIIREARHPQTGIKRLGDLLIEGEAVLKGER